MYICTHALYTMFIPFHCCLFLCIRMCIYMCIYIYMYIYIHICIYIYSIHMKHTRSSKASSNSNSSCFLSTRRTAIHNRRLVQLSHIHGPSAVCRLNNFMRCGVPSICSNSSSRHIVCKRKTPERT